ncbi:MAG: hypothetical protein GQ535_14670 [Rhodobacteraceae bacterium]|nr:hypothetical protein [Paracoccaceae bacterium]
MKSKHTTWQQVYQAGISEAGSIYAPMFTQAQIRAANVEYEESVISEAHGAIGFMLDAANVDTSDIAVDSHAHIAIDRITNAAVRLRPLSYAYNIRFARSLDVPSSLAFGDEAAAATTLRKYLAKNRRPPEPDSDIVPCKLGISCLIAERKGARITRLLTTVRSKNVTWYPNTLHSSFSGGVDVVDVPQNTPATLNDVLVNAGLRECHEELGLAFSTHQLEVLGVWRDLARTSAQAFGVVYVDDLDELDVSLNSESKTYSITDFRESVLKSLWPFKRKPSPEYEFLLHLLRSLKT